jgi:uncharacterized protein
MPTAPRQRRRGRDSDGGPPHSRPRPTGRDGRPRAAESPPRRLVPAGHAFLLVLLALTLAMFMNARGMRKTAAEQPAGAGRDVATTLTSGLVGVSGVFQLDEPRKAMKGLLGRADDDDVVSTIRFAHRAPPRPRVPTKPVYSPAHPLRLWVTGDSLLIDPGKVLLESTAGEKAIVAAGPVETHAATGLAQPEAFNWFEYLPSETRRLHPGVVVIGFGGNDGQDLFGPGGGQHFGTASWIAEYSRRVGGVMDDLVAENARVVWVGLPIPRDGGLAGRFELMNSVYRAEAEKRHGTVLYLDVYNRFAKHGRYADYLPDQDGKLALMREPDGIHYQLAGAEVVADLVRKALPQLVTIRATAPPAPPRPGARAGP